ncbi:MAG: hypothetical protein QF535_09245 [Anaerolineales bacterium]|jgi:hypothetical protein|nr:hypothetical protein [Anaerolineales bacterium]|tara:strand:- start:6429 stop:6641 length:213 start_codon:yes stop_codon:yes gene_type:complete
MKAAERDELLIRMDERIKTIFNAQEDFDAMFTNHLRHHEMWENDMKGNMKWWMGVMLTMCAAAIGYVRVV